MKQLITKSDGTPTKSKVHALQALDKLGIDRSALIEENGQFFYEVDATDSAAESLNSLNDDILKGKMPNSAKLSSDDISVKAVDVKSVSWETEVFDKNNERTKLYIPGTDVVATINGKYPAGQGNPKSAFEICIDGENFKMSVDLLSRIFKVRG